MSFPWGEWDAARERGHRPFRASEHASRQPSDWGSDAPGSGAPGPSVALDDFDVLHVITGEEWGGAPRVVELLAERSSSNVSIACAPHPRTVERFEQHGLAVHPQPHLQSPPAPLSDLRALVDLVSLIRRNDFDLVHCHSTKAGTLGRIAARLVDTPTLFTVHGWGFYNTEYGRLGPLVARVERVLARATDGIVCVSEYDHDEGVRRGILEGVDSWTVYNGIPPVEQPEGEDPLAAAGVETDGFVVGTVGRLVEQKRPTELIRAGQELRDRDHDADVVWIGDGVLEERCRRVAARSTPDRNHFLGFREDAMDLAAGFDVFALPSRFEGFPVSVVEAMFLGLPVVAYDVGGVAEAVIDGETGYVVPEGDRTALVDRLEHLARNPALASRMGERGSERATEMFGADRMIDRYERIHRRVLAGSGADQ